MKNEIIILRDFLKGDWHTVKIDKFAPSEVRQDAMIKLQESIKYCDRPILRPSKNKE